MVKKGILSFSCTADQRKDMCDDRQNPSVFKTLQIKRKYISNQCSPFSEETLHFGMFLGLPYMSFYQEQHVDEDEYRTVIECY
jgi:hypothetical protein